MGQLNKFQSIPAWLGMLFFTSVFSFNCTAGPKTTDEEIVLEDYLFLTIGFSEGEDADGVMNDVRHYNSGPAGSLIHWESSDKNTIATDGTVTRPAADLASAVVTLTATISSGSVSRTKEFVLTVLPEDINWYQDAFIKSSTNGQDDFFGFAVAASGSFLVVGAPEEDSSSTTVTNTDGVADAGDTGYRSGAAFVFKRDGGGNWIQDAHLKASNPSYYDEFGTSVAIDGDTIAVGAPYEKSNTTAIDNTDNSATSNNSGNNRGAVYVFKRDGGGDWIQDAYLKPADSDQSDMFGYSLAVSGETIVVGTPFEDDSAGGVTNTDGAPSDTGGFNNNIGAVYVFKKDGSGDWYQDAFLKPSVTQSQYQFFGESVAIDGDTIVVGALGEKSDLPGIQNGNGLSQGGPTGTVSGAAYVFKADSGGDWYQDAHLKPFSQDADAGFGTSVAIDGDTIAVGAPADGTGAAGIENENNQWLESAGKEGSVYVYRLDTGGDWYQDAHLKTAGSAAASLGSSVAIEGNRIVSGLPGNSEAELGIVNRDSLDPIRGGELTHFSGGVAIFKRGSDELWQQDAFITAVNATANDYFGTGVAIAGGFVFGSSPFEGSTAGEIINSDDTTPLNYSDQGFGAIYVYKTED